MPRRNIERLTKRSVDQLKPIAGRDYSVWDADLTGFGVRVKPSGVKSFQIKYRTANGEQRKTTLGKYGALTVEKARKLALVELGKVAAGADPVGEAREYRNGMTITELCDRYFTEAEAERILHRNRPKKPSTLAVDKGRIERHIKPLLGKKRIADLKRMDIERFMYDVRDGKTAVDVKTGPRRRSIVRGGAQVGAKSVHLLSAMYKFAMRSGWVEDNPCLNIDKPAEGKRTRFLSEAEYKAIGLALVRARELELSPTLMNAAVALMLTGCRRGEILNLKWVEIDPQSRCLRLQDSKTGPQLRPCGKAAFDHLSSLPHEMDANFVFPSELCDGPIKEIRKFLAWLMKESGISGVTPHVFRHSYATVAFELGYSELIIAGLLGHKLSSVTSRYAHRVDYVLADAADRVSETILQRLNSGVRSTVEDSEAREAA